MRMFKPDPGEMVDRQTILELKLEHSNMNASPEVIGKDSNIRKPKKSGIMVMERQIVDKSALNSKAHVFLDELDLICNHLRDNWIPDIADKPEKVEEYDKLYDQLSETNSQLWDLEDQKRVLMKAPDKDGQEDLVVIRRKAEVSDCITLLNDKRADLIKQVNALWNMNTQEKLYC